MDIVLKVYFSLLILFTILCAFCGFKSLFNSQFKDGTFCTLVWFTEFMLFLLGFVLGGAGAIYSLWNWN